MSASLNGRCDHCGGNIEFDAPDTGAIAACPLCGLDTVLQPAADTGSAAAGAAEHDTSPPRKSRRALVIAGIAVVLLALAGTAAAVFIKRANSSGGTADSSRSSSSKNPAARPDDDPPKNVTPVVASLQGGMSAATIRAGREVFLSSCTECHRLYDPAFYSATAWANTLGSMRGKAKLNGKQYEDLQTFVRTLRDP